MNRIDRSFEQMKKQGRKALIPFVVAGDGGMDTTVRSVLELEQGGADLVELGMPFSDPIADGPTIQRAAQRALRHGYTTGMLFRCIEALRKSTRIPIVLMGYFNPIFAYGVESFCRDAANAGADGLLLVDLPLEQLEELHDPFSTAELHTILLVAPTTNQERMRQICARAGGFLYYVSLTGVTGTAGSLDLTEMERNVRCVKSLTDLPVVVGFGITKGSEARDTATFADGVVVGSALVRIMEQYLDAPDLFPRIRRFARELRQGLDEAAGLEIPRPVCTTPAL